MSAQPMFPAVRRWPRQEAPPYPGYGAHDHIDFDDGDDLTPEQEEFWRGRFRCVDCRQCTLCSGEYYMVSDALWAASGIASHGGMLCLACLERRTGRELTLDDFTAKAPRLHAWRRHVAERAG